MDILLKMYVASGNTVPPMFVFPRKNYKDYFVNNGPPDLYWGRV